jgi:predicted PurR-regulated permease PerM
MPTNERLIRALVILLILCALVFLGKFLWDVGRSLADLILLLALAWLLAFILKPVAGWVHRLNSPVPFVHWVRGHWGDRPATWLDTARIPYGFAALSIYLLLLFVLILIIVLAVPGIINQLGQLANQVPDVIQQIPQRWDGIQSSIVQRFNVDPEVLARAVPVDRFTQQATAALPDIIGNAVAVMQRVVSGVASVSLMLILSLYMMLDSERLSAEFNRLVPLRYQDEFRFVFETFNRTFGAFLRGQVLMALITMIFTGVIMRLFGLQLTMITAILSGLAMFIPELGAPIALLAPSIASALQDSSATLPLFIIILVFQQILLRLIMPKILGEAMGMPPLLVLVSVLVSAKVLGFWGFFFGVPLAGALYIIGVVALEQVKQTADAHDAQRATEDQAPHSVEMYEEPERVEMHR